MNTDKLINYNSVDYDMSREPGFYWVQLFNVDKEYEVLYWKWPYWRVGKDGFIVNVMRPYAMMDVRIPNPDELLNLTGLIPLKPQEPVEENLPSKEEVEDAKLDFNKACDLYRSYVGSAETQAERIRRINKFRCGF